MLNIKSLLVSILLASFVSTASAKDDNRIPIALTADERNLVLEEMRTFLATVQIITASLSKEDMATLAKSAKKVGMASSGEIPPALAKKLPMDFKMLAMKVHKGFDQLALDATEMGDQQQTLEQLGSLMGNCVACHAIYRLPEPKE